MGHAALPNDLKTARTNHAVKDDSIELHAMTSSATIAAQFLRCIANPHRLMVLCHLTHGEASVGQLERELGIRQAHLSQQLARLRQDGLVTTRRDSRTIYYALGSDAARDVVGLIYRLFCTSDSDRAAAAD
ncbi:MAG: transcriptional regulator [Acidiphilium sp. 37-64-53]|uniref:ArsR/SmtB family transcription factor n=1 Tax=Acidiphilium TaxID=522 RepID=UPI000BC76BB5|nr:MULTISPECIES: metalloregulator ArsR/SmtB family transcription factor [Acidiphilium]OYW04097.1 MAG: transcriptional regulator [Acidiphilium sp. 37-64-53]OZB31032.1 MAG: transcriptional regulator [Acidiphilium sp. 34-64-41]HQT83335.1 metalloregulator ArsR/SmtB family transcription factor [Acidiphilium rubrum]